MIRRIRFVTLLASLVVLSLQATPVEAASGPQLPACRYADVTTRFRTYDDWNRTMLDTIYRVSSSYHPATVYASTAGIGGGGKVRNIVVPQLRALKRAATAAGVPLYVRSAYRSYSTQQVVFNNWVQQVGYAEALKISARPGHSEHQLGTTIDFTHSPGAAPWDWSDWATTRTGAWMKANTWRFGWIMSYPKGKESRTCYSYEPWHYRFMGVARAKKVHDSGMTLRGWLWYRGGNRP